MYTFVKRKKKSNQISNINDKKLGRLLKTKIIRRCILEARLRKFPINCANKFQKIH